MRSKATFTLIILCLVAMVTTQDEPTVTLSHEAAADTVAESLPVAMNRSDVERLAEGYGDASIGVTEEGSTSSLSNEAVVVLPHNTTEDQYIQVEIPTNGTCEYIADQRERLEWIWRDQCPETTDTYSCIDDLFELPDERRYRCRKLLSDRDTALTLFTANAASLTRFFKERGALGSSLCIVTFFYSSTCPFSAKYAPYFSALPALYPNVYFAAVNAMDNSNTRINSRFGIAGTPTVILWVDGMGISRVDETVPPEYQLPRFLNTYTDWFHPTNITRPVYDGPIRIEPRTGGVDYMIIIAIVTAIVSTTYHAVAYTECGRTRWNQLAARLFRA